MKSALLLLGSVALFVGCGDDDAVDDAAVGPDTAMDADPSDAPSDSTVDADAAPDASDARVDADTGFDDRCNPSCGDTELCGSENEGNGVDDDCDGTVDEGCVCPAYNVTRSCFLGAPDRRNVGACADGIMACTEFMTWGPCMGGSSPGTEVCDNLDNDCDGNADNGLSGCATTLRCPATELAHPLQYHELRGSEVLGAGTAYHWTIECPETVATCPTPDDPDAADTSIYFIQSGAYRAHLEIETAEGMEECGWVINVGGAGLRVELSWDTQGEGHGDTDVDLHLHRQTTTVAGMETDFFDENDCYYANCTASNNELDWDLLPTAETEACSSAPHGHGNEWVTRGSCTNPRLDVDVVTCDPEVREPDNQSFCSPENINVDNPPLGVPYRIMVHYFSEHSFSGDTNPRVTVFCNGEQSGSFVPPRPLQNGSTDHWLVGDVVFADRECGETAECHITPLEMILSGSDFGPDWSVDD